MGKNGDDLYLFCRGHVFPVCEGCSRCTADMNNARCSHFEQLKTLPLTIEGAPIPYRIVTARMPGLGEGFATDTQSREVIMVNPNGDLTGMIKDAIACLGSLSA